MRKILIIFLLATTLKLCRVSDSFIFPTMEESYALSGAVIQGTVDNYAEEGVLENKEIYLKDAVYYKGCGPSRIKISGYSSGARCSIFPPRTGKKIIVFVCKDPNNVSWILHTYKPYAGQYSANTRHMNSLKKISNPNSDCVSSDFIHGQCRNVNN